jgi:hypothetical protein
MASKKRPDVSWINPDAKGTNKDMFLNAVKTITETTETQKDRSQGPSLIAAVGAKYKQNPTTAIAQFKKSMKENPITRNTGGVTTKSSTVNKVYRPMGN